MSWLRVPEQRAGAGSVLSDSGEGLDRVAADIVVAQARAASKLASQTGALKAYLEFEKTAEEKRIDGRRPVHNERFLGNTLKQIDAHNRRQLSAGAAREGGQLSRDRDSPESFRGATKVTEVFESEGTLGIFFERNSCGEAVVKAIRPAGLAAQRPQLRPGLVLAAVQGVKVSSLGYTHALDLMKGSGRPLSLKFRNPAAKEAKRRLKEHRKQRKKKRKRERRRRRAERGRTNKRSRDDDGSCDDGGPSRRRHRSCSSSCSRSFSRSRSRSRSPETTRTRADSARTSGRGDDSVPFVEGERVLYHGRDGQEEVVIASVDCNVAPGEDPFVAVKMPNGTVRDTTFERLCKLAQSK